VLTGVHPAFLVALGGSDCERLRVGWLAQPANAVSSLAYVAAGLWLLWRAGRPGVNRGMLLGAGVATILIGVGSVAYHGPQPGWAQLAHDASAAWLSLVVIGQIGWRFAQADDRRLAMAGLKAPAACLGVALAAAPALAAFPVLPSTGSAPRLPGGLVVAVVLVVGAVLAHPTTTPAALAAWRRSAVWMALALAAYAAGRTGSALCRPGVLWQPHAAWHVVSAAGLLCAVLGFAARAPGRIGGAGSAAELRR